MNRLLQRLGTGGVVSGVVLAEEFGVARAAIGRQVGRLRAEGWPIQARPGRGYQLEPGCCPLDEAALTASLGRADTPIKTLDVLDEVDSTSSWLARQPFPGDGGVRLCIAEIQHAGRGRHGKHWTSLPGRSITFSAARAFDLPPGELTSLGIAVGVGLAECLANQGLAGIEIKWPNDLVRGDAKLGGILVDVRGDANGPTRAVVGVGINYNAVAPPDERCTTDIVRLAGDNAPSRDAIATATMAATAGAIGQFARSGLAAFRERWQRLDRLAGRPIRAWSGQRVLLGTAHGIAASGALRMTDEHGREHELHSAQVSVRARA